MIIRDIRKISKLLLVPLILLSGILIISLYNYFSVGVVVYDYNIDGIGIGITGFLFYIMFLLYLYAMLIGIAFAFYKILDIQEHKQVIRNISLIIIILGFLFTSYYLISVRQIFDFSTF